MTPDEDSSDRLVAVLVHVFTALGIVVAMLATLAVVEEDWRAMFGWLLLALFIDAVDGPLARRHEVLSAVPDFSGERLDWIIDYITYVFIPAFALIQADFLPGRWGFFLASVMTMSSLYHFCDTGNKSDDGNFVGFPAVWNIVAFYIFVFTPNITVISAFVLVFGALTFVRLKWLHPVRAKWARPLNLAVTLAVVLASLAVVWQGFPASDAQKLVLGACALYFVGLTLVLGVAPRKEVDVAVL